MVASYVVYVDESGDEGFKFDRGSSEWFVLSGVIIEKQHDIEVVKLISEVKALLKRQDNEKDTLHFANLVHRHRIPLIDKVATAALKTITIAIHKPSIHNLEAFQQRFAIYYYASRLLFERVSWYCQQHVTTGDGSAGIMFSNRAGMSYDDMKEYMRELQSKPQSVSINWDIIQFDQIKSYSAKLRGMQIADAVASGYYFALERDQYGFCEPRYATMLKPTVYRVENCYEGYGIKVFPDDATELNKTKSHLEWLYDIYKFSK